ncbi:MAG: hypothetical protein SFV54_13710 [Bryobacteraceae bacterium]|nr:hypothetical protein [Bryobacteraceae bacterium]
MAQSYPDLEDVGRRWQRHWNIDGLSELTMGGLWVLWGVAFGLPKLLPEGGWTKVYWSFAPLVLMASGAASSWVMKRLKEKFTYRRAGYAAPAEARPLVRISVAGLAAGIAAGVALLARRGAPEELAAPALALVLAAALLVPVIRWRLTHFAVLSGIALVLSFVLGAAPLPLDSGMIAVLLTMGTASMVVGWIRLRRFLRLPPGDAE